MNLRPAILLLLSLSPALGGCAREQGAKPRAMTAAEYAEAIRKPEPAHRDWEVRPMAPPPVANLPVKQGTLPLAYVLEAPGVLRVTDLTRGAQLLQMQVDGQSFLAIDADAGVNVDGKTMLRGPLDPSHRYGIFVQTSSPNEIRTQTIHPGQAAPRRGPAPDSPPAPVPAGPATPTTRRSEP